MCSIFTQFCSQFAPGSSPTFLWHFGSSHSQLGAPTPSWELPLPNPLGAVLLLVSLFFGAPITLLYSGNSLLQQGVPRIYKFQNTPLLLSPGGTTFTICVNMCVREFSEKGTFFKERLRSEQIRDKGIFFCLI